MSSQPILSGLRLQPMNLVQNLTRTARNHKRLKVKCGSTGAFEYGVADCFASLGLPVTPGIKHTYNTYGDGIYNALDRAGSTEIYGNGT